MKDNFKEWLQKSIEDLKNERDYNEQLYKDGKNENWIPMGKAMCSDVFMNYWGYTSMILQLENVLKKYELR